MAIPWPTGPTNQSRPIANLFTFYVLVQFRWNLLCGLHLPCNYPAPFMLLLCSYSTPPWLQLLPCPCRTPALLLPWSCFSPTIALLQPCSYPVPDPAIPSLAVFIIIISTLRLLSARREPPFMVLLISSDGWPCRLKLETRPWKSAWGYRYQFSTWKKLE